MRKIYSTLLAGTLLLPAITTQAQQLPNYDFAEWKTACGTTEAFGTGSFNNSPKTGEFRARPGVEPTSWNGSNVNQRVMATATSADLVVKGDLDGNPFVKLTNIKVGVKIGTKLVGDEAPGYITFGNPWVYASMTVSDCDGGTYGGMPFTYKPDAISVKCDRTDSNNENSYIIAYLWNGEFKSNVGSKSNPDQTRTDVDRAVLGKITPLESSTGKLIASCDYAFHPAANAGFSEVLVPINYFNNETPEKMNVIICSGDYWNRDAMVENTSLNVDDVKFVYYSRLKTLTVGGKAIALENGKYDGYTVELAAAPVAADVVAEVLGQSAVANVNVDEVAKTITVTVQNVDADTDGQSSHVYTIAYTLPAEDNATQYDGYLNVSLMGVQIVDNQVDKIYITEDGDKALFELRNFTIDLGEPVNLGNITINNTSVATDGAGNKHYTASVKGMELAEGSINADVNLNGYIYADGVIEMAIDVLWNVYETTQMPIPVTFTSYPLNFIAAPEEGKEAEVTHIWLKENDRVKINLDTPCTYEMTAVGGTEIPVKVDENGFVSVVNLWGECVITCHEKALTRAAGDVKAIYHIHTFDSTTGVTNVGTDVEAPAEYYNLQGVKMNGTLAPGLYIERRGSKATKIIVK